MLIDSNFGTYTEMRCKNVLPFYFPYLGAFIFVIPFISLFLLLKNFIEKYLFFIGLGFNISISIADFPAIATLQLLGFSVGVGLILYGEILLIDKLLYLIFRWIK